MCRQLCFCPILHSNWELFNCGDESGAALGTLIASMASLISYKQIAARYPEKKTAYLRTFTFWNVIFSGCFVDHGFRFVTALWIKMAKEKYFVYITNLKNNSHVVY